MALSTMAMRANIAAVWARRRRFAFLGSQAWSRLGGHKCDRLNSLRGLRAPNWGKPLNVLREAGHRTCQETNTQESDGNPHRESPPISDTRTLRIGGVIDFNECSDCMELRSFEGPTVLSPCDSIARPMRSKVGMKSRKPFGRLGRIAWPGTTASYGSLFVFGPAYLPINHHATMHSCEPTNAAIKSSKETLISPRPKSMPNSPKNNESAQTGPEAIVGF